MTASISLMAKKKRFLLHTCRKTCVIRRDGSYLQQWILRWRCGTA